MAVVPGSPPSGAHLTDLAITLGVAAAYIGVSATLIMFNKYLMHEERFPFAVPLTLGHMGVSSMLLLGLLKAKPEMFPSLTDPDTRVVMDKSLFASVMPVAGLFSAQLVLTNTAYLEASVAFLQMMKEGNIVLVYCFSLVLGLETWNYLRMCIVVCIILATSLTVTGEISFSLAAFCIQGTSQLFESSKLILQSILLSPTSGRKLDALTYVLLVSPLCLGLLSCCFGFLTFWHGSDLLRAPGLSDIIKWSPVLLLSSLVAFALNILIAFFLKRTSPIALILAGIVKDCSIVFCGVVFFSDQISRQQSIGFALQLCLVGYWSYLKAFGSAMPPPALPPLDAERPADKFLSDKFLTGQEAGYGTGGSG
mmetsp:Transcript_78900/g.207140  ORF Transcript_78900/g.207140 Transcript_78900/m.207140 type:complete len:366 (-) Transcript_78900:81-1178(-)